MSDCLSPRLLRCARCGHWWSSVIEGAPCPCGGELAEVDLEAHAASLPRAPYDPSKDPKRTK